MFTRSLFTLAVFTLSSTALSSPLANLKITGSIIPPTCIVNGGDNDLLYSLGNISPAVIPQDSTYNELPSLSNSLTVICDAETFLTFKATDNYPNAFIQTPGMNINFRAHAFNLVNSTETNKTVGGISFNWSNVTVDGKPAYLSRANDGDNDNGTWSPENRLVKGATTGWTKMQQKYVSSSDLELLSGKAFEATLSNNTGISYGVARTYLHSRTMLSDEGVDISSGVDYLGQIILTLNFGV